MTGFVPPSGTGSGVDSSMFGRFRSVWQLEFSNFRWRLVFCALVARLLPEKRATHLRTSVIRTIGLDIGAGTRIEGMPKFQSSRPGPLRPRLRIGANCTIGTRVILEFGEVLTIGNRVTIADGAVILTTTHQLGPKERRAGPLVWSPVLIGDDVQIGADAVVLPGVTIGAGAHVLPNSVVNANVAAGVTVRGIPARPIRPA